jgi:prevent-host-death family protein
MNTGRGLIRKAWRVADALDGHSIFPRILRSARCRTFRAVSAFKTYSYNATSMAQFKCLCQAHFSELIEKDSPGEEITVTKNNRPVARIVSLLPFKRQSGTDKRKDHVQPLRCAARGFADYQ